jgi:hypothetical protein
MRDVLDCPTGHPQIAHKLFRIFESRLWISCACIFVALQQLGSDQIFSAVFFGLFAYNDRPTIAVAKRLLVRGASHHDAPFFHA